MPGLHITGGTPLRIDEGRRFLEEVVELGSHLGSGHHRVGREIGSLTDLHQLDEARGHAALPGEAGERLDLVVVLSPQHDRVQLDLLEARGERGVEAPEHAGEVAAPGEARKAPGHERVDRHRQPPQPRPPQRPRQPVEPRRVGRHRQIGEPQARQIPHQVDHPRVQEGLPSRQAHPPHPRLDEPRDHHLPGRVVEPVIEVAVVAVRTAIHAGQIAAIGQRQTHAAGRGPRGRRRRLGGRERRQERQAAELGVHRATD